MCLSCAIASPPVLIADWPGMLVGWVRRSGKAGPLRRLIERLALVNFMGPMTQWRPRTERIVSTLLGETHLATHWPGSRRYSLDHRGFADPIARAESILRARGFATPDEAAAVVPDLPARALHCQHLDVPQGAPAAPEEAQSDEDYLLCALVLGRCSEAVYDPAKPVIWTLKRLSRPAVLYTPGGFYDGD